MQKILQRHTRNLGILLYISSLGSSLSTVMDPHLPPAGDQVEACAVARYAANQKGGHHLIDAQGDKMTKCLKTKQLMGQNV